MIKLTEHLAQNIVDKMMEVIPYNVNIMNADGIIIGSGDKSRIGQLHQGAVKAIREEKLIAVHKIAGGAKPGVNVPIYFNNEIMGVIGISGDPSTVEAFASIVKVTAELLINQEYAFNERRTRERVKEEFLYQWAYSKDYDENFLHMAEALHIDLNINRTAVVINNGEKNIVDKLKKYLYPEEYVVRINLGRVLIFMKADNKLNKRIITLCESLYNITKVGVGSKQEIMSKSVQQAIKAIGITEKLGMKKKICNYSELAFIDSIVKTIKKDSFYSLVEKINEESKGLDLIDTLITYIMLNGEVNSTAAELHIHRNSLNYRLKKIQEITGKDPRNFVELMELFIACILYKLK
ncbi:CdaR family transcriptional regulator [Clostridium thermarum]|uniref:CdaR family transcriptional regulator n=1 Tax=Clostridium thermarum TaxID=1716543 RepID=UPI001122ABE5|nr:sugar diacid recognition domain-containing protein [Clostridium thermarum]